MLHLALAQCLSSHKFDMCHSRGEGDIEKLNIKYSNIQHVLSEPVNLA